MKGFLRPTVRLKLTLAYGGLFLLAGAILLALNYALVSRSVQRPTAGVGFTFVAGAPVAGVGLPPDALGPIRVIINERGQAAGDGVGQRLFVFHHQYAHGAIVPALA